MTAPQRPDTSSATRKRPASTALGQVQAEFAGHIRDPLVKLVPAGIEDRRMGIYRDLVYRNLEGFVAGAFPVLRSILPDAQWHRLVRDFLQHYHCQTPYFLEISQEFIRYLEQRESTPDDPPYMLELAHYEWVELALDVAEAEPDWPAIDVNGDLLRGSPVVSPTAWSLAYRFPVHRIGPGWQDAEAEAPMTYLVVYRNREDEVKFMVINAVTARLLELIVVNEELTGEQAVGQLAIQMEHPDIQALCLAGAQILAKLQATGIILGVRRG
jgi:hypothetical protein